LLIKKFSGTREFSKIIVDPFGGAKPRPLRRGKEAPLRVNPCLPAGRLSNPRPLGREAEGLTTE